MDTARMYRYFKSACSAAISSAVGNLVLTNTIAPQPLAQVIVGSTLMELLEPNSYYFTKNVIDSLGIFTRPRSTTQQVIKRCIVHASHISIGATFGWACATLLQLNDTSFQEIATYSLVGGLLTMAVITGIDITFDQIDRRTYLP